MIAPVTTCPDCGANDWSVRYERVGHYSAWRWLPCRCGDQEDDVAADMWTVDEVTEQAFCFNDVIENRWNEFLRDVIDVGEPDVFCAACFEPNRDWENWRRDVLDSVVFTVTSTLLCTRCAYFLGVRTKAALPISVLLSLVPKVEQAVHV